MLTHEAFGAYPHGFAAIDELARSFGMCLIGLGVFHLPCYLPARGVSKRFNPGHEPGFFRLHCQRRLNIEPLKVAQFSVGVNIAG